MSEKILVAYASRTDSTTGVAEAIGKVLAENGADVEVRPMQEVTDLSPYSAVVAGSAIRGNTWLPEALLFVELHQAELAQKPFAAFLVCITLAMKDADKYRQGVSTWMEPVRSLVHPVSEGLFAGALDLQRLSFKDRLPMQIAVTFGFFPKGDHRDWNAIRAWAEGISPMLQETHVSMSEH